MPVDNPAAYQQMTTDELVNMIEAEVGNLDTAAAEAGLDISSGDALPEDAEPLNESEEQALSEAGEESPPGMDAESALGSVLASGLSGPDEILDALRTQGFELVRMGSAPGEELPEAMAEEMGEETEAEIPHREARRKAAERVAGGTV
jgi:hypothetical protein